MTSPNSTEDEIEKVFIPKRRAPYLLHEEVVKKNKTDKKQRKKQNLSQENESCTDVLLEKDEVENNKFQDKRITNSVNYHEEVSRLSGIQKKIALYFVDCCLTKRDIITGPITAETLCLIAKTTPKTLKKVLARMAKKKIIMRAGGKRGKGGFSEFKLEKGFIDIARLQFSMENKHVSTVNLYSSGIKEENTQINPLPKEWEEINFEEIKEIGFGISQIRQLYNKKSNTPEVVQTSINNFAYTLKVKPEKLEKYDNKIAPFMSTLLSGGAWIESDYLSPNEIAFNQIIKQREQRIAKFREVEEKYLLSEYTLWELSLTETDKNKIIPENIRNSRISAAKNASLKTYFKQAIWPKKIPKELISLSKELGL